jgi:hypothetical protein
MKHGVGEVGVRGKLRQDGLSPNRIDAIVNHALRLLGGASLSLVPRENSIAAAGGKYSTLGSTPARGAPAVGVSVGLEKQPSATLHGATPITKEGPPIAAQVRSTSTPTSFSEAVKSAKKNDLVYFDPPYLPLSPSASFSQYAKDNFGVPDHEELAETIARLKKKGVHVILSNSDTPETRRIFGKTLTLRQIMMNRSISAAAHARTPVNEVLGTSYPIKKGTEISELKVISRSR